MRLPIIALSFLLLAACADSDPQPPEYTHDQAASGDIFYWHNTKVTADTVPDILKAQDILERDMAACQYDTRARNHWAQLNDPVSTPDGHVVDEMGAPREETPLPLTYEVTDCMKKRGWVRLEHYYTVPY